MNSSQLLVHYSAAVDAFAARTTASCCRIEVRVSGPGGMARLQVVEALLHRIWPPGTAKEYVWLTDGSPHWEAAVRLRAFAADGRLIGLLLLDREAAHGVAP